MTGFKNNMKEDKRIPLPQAFSERMERLLGDEYPAFIESYEREKTSGLRLNPLKWKAADREGAAAGGWREEEAFREKLYRIVIPKILRILRKNRQQIRKNREKKKR